MTLASRGRQIIRQTRFKALGMGRDYDELEQHQAV